MIKNIIFDIGRVMISYDWRAFLMEDYHDPDVVEILMDAFFGHGIWDELDRGAMSADELTASFAQYAPGMEDRIRPFILHFAEKFRQFPYARPLVRALKEAGYGVYYLSNYSYFALDANPEVLDFTELMDGGIYSCDVKLTKPDSAIYEALCRKYNLTPSECLFIDDKQANVDGAIRIGMVQSFVFRGYEDALEQLRVRAGFIAPDAARQKPAEP